MIWNSYKQSLSKLSNKEKGDSFERLTKQYLTYDPKYATKLKHVWLLSEVPSSIHKKLNLPDQDQGIDLICETNEGEYWAIQSKYHEDESTSQTWKSLSTFTGLAFGVCKNISFGLVCTTAERFTKTLKNQDNIGFCTGEVWRSLDESFFDSFLKHRKPKKLKAFKPYTHQKRAISNAYKHYVVEKESRGKMIMPCGTGKSLTAFWIANKLNAKRIIVAVPSLSLIRQTLQVWLRESYAKGWDVDWITVCSDESVGKISRDDLVVLKQDLGIPAVTNPKAIAKWLRKKHSGKVVVFTTYQSGKAIAQASKLARRNFDLGIMDEAHKTVGSRDKTFSHLLFDKNIRIAKRVFMTATERRYAGNKDEVISMDDLDVYGDTFEFLSFKDALEAVPPILSDYKILTKIISKEEVADLVRKRAFVKPTKGKWDEDIEADMLAALIILRKAIRRFKIRHAITFHSSIAKAKAFTDNQPIFSDLFPQYWKTDNFHVSGKMPTSVRARHMEEFEASKRAIMTNARCLTEGVDVPDIDCVLFADPKKSTIDIVQAVGRALRLSKDKKLGYVIVPVVIDDTDKFNESSAFQTILMTLRALASNDERIIDYFRARSQNKRTYTNIQIEVDERIAERVDVKDFTKQLELKVWNKLARLSWMPFEEAREFVQKLDIKSSNEWALYCRGQITHLPKKPIDIPYKPHMTYKNDGWISWGDWLGTGRVADQLKNWRNFDDAHKFVLLLELESLSDWKDYCSGNLIKLGTLPEDIPKAPHVVYRDKGWLGFKHWLTGTKAKNKDRSFLSYNEAKKFVQRLKLKSLSDWHRYCSKGKKPSNIPRNPQQHFSLDNRGWISWGDFLGTGNIHPGKLNFLSYKEAKKFVNSLNLKSEKEWRQYKNGILSHLPPLPDGIPKNPTTYKDKGWKGMGDWLGTDNVQLGSIEYLPYSEAKNFVIRLKLKSTNDWYKYLKGEFLDLPPLPINIPKSPRYIYKNKGWNSMGDWLGTGNIQPGSISYHNYEKAKKLVQKLNLKSNREWRAYSKKDRPEKIPANPDKVYKQWESWGIWLSTNKTSSRLMSFLSYADAKLIVKKLNLKSIKDWKKYLNSTISHPSNIPRSPENYYKKTGEWISWADFLGYIPYRTYDDFKSARKYVRKLGLKYSKDWFAYCKTGSKPKTIPRNVELVYKNKGWISWPDFLGYEPKRKKK